MCHQAVEKGLKALYLIRSKEKIIISHSLVEIGKALKIDSDLMTDIRKLTSEYILTKYPDATNSVPYENYDERIAQKRLNSAKRVFKWLDTQMKN